MAATHGIHWLEREDQDKITIVRFKTPKKMDEDVIRTVFDPIATIVSIGRNQLIMNLGAVDYLPSMALGKLVMLNRKIQASNGRLALCHLHPHVLEILETTHLSTLFNIHATEEEALKHFP